MIGVNPDTGKTVTGHSALACRFRRILTTQLTSRTKRRGVGNKAVSQLGKMQTPTTALIVQNLTLDALANSINGLIEFKAEQCKATPTATGFHVAVKGRWRGEALTLTGDL